MNKQFLLSYNKNDKIQSKLQQKKKNKIQSIENKQKQSLTTKIDQISLKILQSQKAIQQTSQKLDVDLFLKQQKKKRTQYAKHLNQQFQIQKKQRQEKLYKKYRQNDKEQNKLRTNNAKNIKVSNPIEILRIIKYSLEDHQHQKTIFMGHAHTLSQLKLDKIELCNSKNIIKEQQSYLLTDKNNRFSNIKQIANNSFELQLFPIQMYEQQLQPSQWGQNLMNALAMMSKIHSQLLYQQNDEFVLCKMFLYGERRSVLSTKTIQVRDFEHKSVIMSSKMYNKDMFWPQIIQKCCKKLLQKDRFLFLKLNDAINIIYGLDCQIVQINNKNYISENFIKILIILLKSNTLIGFCNNGYNQKIYNNRIYPLLSIEKEVINVQKNKKIIKNNNKKQYKKQIKLGEYKFKLSNIWKGCMLNGQNNNNFSILQIFELFNNLIIIKQYPQKWYCYQIKIKFFSSGPININNNQWTKNIQYNFTLTKKCYIRFIMRNNHQNQQRIKENIYGFIIFNTKNGQTVISCMNMQQFIVKCKSNDVNSATYCAQFDKGTYIIVPYSNLISDKSYQFFVMDLFVEKQQVISFGKARFYNFQYVKIEDHNNKVIQKIQSTQKFQRPKLEQFLIPRIKCSQKKVIPSIAYLQSLKLTILEGIKYEHLFIPGLIGGLLIDKKIERPIKKIQNKISKLEFKNNSLAKQQYNQNLKILLGYDMIYGEEINLGHLKQLIFQHEQQIDLANFQLGQSGLITIMNVILDQPRINTIKLNNNLLNDSSITYLCYYLDKSNRVQLKQLDLRENCYGNIGIKALNGLQNKFTQLKIISNF